MTNIYIASCVKGGGIYHYTLSENNVLDFCEKTTLDEPMYMIIRNEKMYILLRQPDEKTNFSGELSIDIDGTGKLFAPSRIISTKGVVACHLEVSDDNIYAVNYVSGSVIKLPDTLVTHSGHGLHKVRQAAPHTHFVHASPDGKYILVTDLGLDKIFVYNKDLKLVSEVSVPSGHGPRHLAFSDDGKIVYCVNELGSSVSIFSYSDGELKLQNTISALPKDFSGDNISAAIRIKDNYLYVSNRGHNSISVFEIKDSYNIVLKECVDCGGNSPRDFNIIDDVLICTNEKSDNVTVFKLNNYIPEIISESELNIPSPLCVAYKKN